MRLVSIRKGSFDDLGLSGVHGIVLYEFRPVVLAHLTGIDSAILVML